MKFNKELFFAIAIAFFLTALPASAAILPACATDVNAVLQLSCFLNLLISVSNWILGITGSLALLYFVYGGFLFLTSRGVSAQIEKGKTVLTQATIGIIIIFGAYLAINFLVANVLKAKFTTEIPQEAAPAAPTAPAQNQSTRPSVPQNQICVCGVTGGLLSATMAKNLILNTCQQMKGSYSEDYSLMSGAAAGACALPNIKDKAACDTLGSVFKDAVEAISAAVPGQGPSSFCIMVPSK